MEIVASAKKVEVIGDNGPRLKVRLLGVPEFWIDGIQLEVRFRKSRALMLFLTINAGSRVTRQRLRDLLWEDDDDQKSMNSLRQAWFSMRRLLDDAGFQGYFSSRTELGFEAGFVETDVDGMLESRQFPERLLQSSMLAEDFGAGLDEVGEGFHSWLTAQRHITFTRLQHMLEVLIDTSPAHSDDHLNAAISLNNLDPTNERACRVLIADRAVKGDMAGAVEIYNSLWRLLDEEFDSEPTMETQSLIERVKLDRHSAETIPPMITADLPALANGPSSTEFLDRGPIIYVRPFDVFNDNEECKRIALTLRHDLISRLIRFREWSVMDNELKDEIDKDESVFELTCRIDEDGDGVTASVNLKDLRTNRFVWSEYTDANRSDIIDRQANMVGRIALALNVHISAERLSRLSLDHNVTIDLYDRLLKGQEMHFRWAPEQSDIAAVTFRNLIDEKPFFAPSYSSLAQVINSRHIMFPGEYRDPERIKFALHLGRTAMRLDPLDSRAHLSTAWSEALVGNFSEAAENYRTAYNLNENDPWTSVSTAAGLGLCGQKEMARELAIRSLDMGLVASPLQWSYQVAIWFACEDYEHAIEAFERSDGGFFGVEAWNLASLVHLSRTQEARGQFSALLKKIAAKWYGSTEPTQEAMERWLLQCFPIGDQETKDRFLYGLKKAGLETVH